ncbi:MAG: flagellar biosynthetic protein FliR [Pseudomonadota bacterium]
MLEFNIAEIDSLVASYFLPLFRIAAFLSVVPIIGTRMVQGRIRLLLALMITAILAPLLPPLNFEPGFNGATIIAVIQEVLIGVLMGFMLQVFFHLFVIAGQIIAMQMGLGFASMIDPSNGVSVAVLSQFFVILTTLLFLSMNGHLVMIETMVDSFRRIPAGGEFLMASTGLQVVEQGTWMFAHALLISLPFVSALLIVNLAFGVMTKAAPQLNVFSLGFPTAVVLGSVFLWFGLSGFAQLFQQLLDMTLRDMTTFGS